MRDLAPIIGMAAMWVSAFKQLLYPSLYAYYRTGHDGALAAQAAHAIALVAAAFLVCIAHSQLAGLLGRGRWIVAALGFLGSCGIALRVASGLPEDATSAAMCAGAVFSALYVPVHLTFWALYASKSSPFGTKQAVGFSFLLFVAAYALLTLTNCNSTTVSIACPLVSAAMALISPRIPDPASGAITPSTERNAGDANSKDAGFVEFAVTVDRPMESDSVKKDQPGFTEPTTHSKNAPIRRVSLNDEIGELPEGFAEAFDLSEREAELAAYAHRNYSARKIAGELFIAESTVYTHLKRIYRKTDVHSKHELIDLIDSWKADA